MPSSDRLSYASGQEPIVCVITRFRLKHPWLLPLVYMDYRRVLMKGLHTPGLLKATFVIENFTTCYSLSFWTGPRAIAVFGGGVVEHVDAARRVFSRVRFNSNGPEIWSAKLQVGSLGNNLNWEGFDLGETVDVARSGSDEAVAADG